LQDLISFKFFFQTDVIPMLQMNVPTSSRVDMVDITAEVRDAIARSGISSGICVLFVPHTTAGITINENADPSVQADMMKETSKIVPFQDGYRHMEGNSAAHLKSSLYSPSLTLIIEKGKPVLGTWQGIYFCEFDGPRQRRLFVKVVEG